MPDIRDLTVSIIGLGLIGGSYAKGLRRLGTRRILGVDIDEATLEKAEFSGTVDEGFRSPETALVESDLVVIALYPQLAIDFIKTNLGFFKPGCVITDVSGIKARVLDEVMAFLPEGVDFVGGHPMAGGESLGFDHSSADIFIGASYLLTPHKKNRQESIDLVRTMALALGCRRVREVEPDVHDRIIARTSQLPHVVASALIAAAASGTDGMIDCFLGGGLRDTTRIADINGRLWSELLISNSGPLLPCIEDFEERIKRLRVAIGSGDAEELEAIFAEAMRLREGLYGNAPTLR
jgi:prephenate dehydrogenase